MSNYVKHNSDWDNFEHINYVRSGMLSIKTYTNVTIKNNGEFLKEEVIIENACNIKTSEDEKVVYLGHISNSHFGNFLIDYLSRLWYVVNDLDCHSVVYTAKSDVIAQNKWMRDILEYVGITKVYYVSSMSFFKSVVVPERSFVHGGFIYPQYSGIYETIYKAMPKDKWPVYDKIYLTRAKLNFHKEVGEWRFEKFFNENGFVSIALETMPLAQQAWIMRHAQTIASIEGTHAHAVVWRECAAGAGEQIILRKQSEIIPRQMMLNQLWKINTIFIDAYNEPYKGFPISHDRGPFLLRWTPQIEQYTKDRGMIVPEECRRGKFHDIIIYSFKCIYYWCKHTIKNKIVIKIK